jgi:uncharacterized membrane protein YqjE
METKRTDKDILFKGLKLMLICLFMMFSGPTLMYVALSNDDKPLYILLIIVALLLCIGAVFFLFKGINTIMSSMFGKRNK